MPNKRKEIATLADAHISELDVQEKNMKLHAWAFVSCTV